MRVFALIFLAATLVASASKDHHSKKNKKYLSSFRLCGRKNNPLTYNEPDFSEGSEFFYRCSLMTAPTPASFYGWTTYKNFPVFPNNTGTGFTQPFFFNASDSQIFTTGFFTSNAGNVLFPAANGGVKASALETWSQEAPQGLASWVSIIYIFTFKKGAQTERPALCRDFDCYYKSYKGQHGEYYSEDKEDRA